MATAKTPRDSDAVTHLEIDEDSVPEIEDEADEMDATSPAAIDEMGASPEPVERVVARAEGLQPGEIRRVLQSLLFVADRPLSVTQLREVTGLKEDAVQEGLSTLAEEWQEGKSGLVLSEVAEGWQLRTERASADAVRRLLQVKPQRLTRAALETLAIVAYRQPVTRPEIEDVRGVDCGAVLKALLERRMVKIIGKKEEVGRPLLYGTTREFLSFFALRDLSGLPTLHEFHELSEEHQSLLAGRDSKAPEPPARVALEALTDPAFEDRRRTQERASEEALGELEAAMSTAEAQARTVAATLAPPPVPPEANETT